MIISIYLFQFKKLNRDLLKSKKKAEESDRLKSTFLANMSHEIRTPMNSILGFSELMSDPELAEDQRLQYSDQIRKSGNYLMNIVNDIIYD